MNKPNKLLMMMLLISAAACLSACGAKTESSTDSASRAVDTTSSAKVYANCNQGTSRNASMKVSIESYVENGAVRNDLMRVKFNTLDANFINGGNYIQMYRWLANSSGQTYLDPTPVNFRLEAISNGTILTNYMSSMRWSDLTYAMNTLGVSTVADLFARVRITVDIRDANADYDVLKVVYYNASTNAATDQIDLLMPLFAISPADYATQPDGSARPAILQNLHPFKSMSGWSSSELTSMANGYCF